MVTTDGSIKIINFMTFLKGNLVLEQGHYVYVFKYFISLKFPFSTTIRR